MLPIYVKEGEYWDERNNEFIYTKPYKLNLEHSLVSISKWESKWHISFFETKLNHQQFISYIECMTLNKDAPRDVYLRLSRQNLDEIMAYINDPMTASTVKDIKKQGHSREFVTTELVYYWMAKFNLPVEFEKWHINRLIMLIKICFEKENPQKMTQSEQAKYYNETIARNRAKFHL